MKKLAVDEIIGGLIDAYEKLLIIISDDGGTNILQSNLDEYYVALGEVKALRWVLGQSLCSLDGTMPEEEEEKDNAG
jgi:hypothetical protein